jgi:hypothetical protein
MCYPESAAMKPRTYIETTIASYLTARPSRDLVLAAEQEITREWWDGRNAYELFISQLVLDEASAGDTDAAGLRLNALREAALLDTTDDAISLGRHLLEAGGLPTKAAADALHIAIAATIGSTTCSLGTAPTSRTRECAARSRVCAVPQATIRRLSAPRSSL